MHYIIVHYTFQRSIINSAGDDDARGMDSPRAAHGDATKLIRYLNRLHLHSFIPWDVI